jgi:hypothetical protein
MAMSKSIAAAVVFALGAGAAHAQDGTATGTFTVNGKAAKLAYVYAIADGPAIRVTLSDVKLTPDQLQFPFGLQGPMKAGQVHAVVADIDATKKTVINTMLYDKAFAMDLVSMAGVSNKFDGTIDKTTVTGKLYRTEPGTSGKIPYDFSATFKAPIQRPGK